MTISLSPAPQERRTAARVVSGGGEVGDFHPGIDGFHFFAGADGGGDALFDHGVGDGDDFMRAAGG